MRRTRWLARALGLVIAVSCGRADDIGPSGGLVGGTCVSDRECARLCLRGNSHYPGGMCTVPCLLDGDCPAGTACVDDAGGICAVLCRLPADCAAFGPGFTCDAEKRKGAPGDAPVCRVP
jgi:hypothetical protein